MSVECGAAGAFGLYLPLYEQVSDIYNELKTYVHRVMNDEDPDEANETGDPESFARIPEFCNRLIAAFAKIGIVVPPGASLIWTDSEESRPAECSTESEEWVLGWGAFTAPWNYPQDFDPSFKKAASFSTWAWISS